LPAISGPKRLVLRFPAAYNRQCEFCSDPVRLNRVLDALERVTGESWDLRLETAPGRNGHVSAESPAAPTAAPTPPPALQHPLVQSAVDVLGAKLLQVDEGFGLAKPVPDDADDDVPMTDPEEQ